MDSKSFVVIKIGNYTYALSSTEVKEILETQEHIKYPQLPEYIDGLFRYRDRVLPLIDLPKVLKTPVKRRNNAKTVILELRNGVAAAITVDAVTQMKDISNEAIDEMPFLEQRDVNRFCKGILNDEEVITILDTGAIFTETNISTQSISKIRDNLKKKISVQKYTIYKVGQFTFCTPTTDIKKILEGKELTNSEDSFFYPLEDEHLKVIDCASQLGIRSVKTDPEHKSILLLENSRRKIGFMVDAVAENTEFKETDLQMLSWVARSKSNEMIKATILSDGKIIYLLDLNSWY